MMCPDSGLLPCIGLQLFFTNLFIPADFHDPEVVCDLGFEGAYLVCIQKTIAMGIVPHLCNRSRQTLCKIVFSNNLNKIFLY